MPPREIPAWVQQAIGRSGPAPKTAQPKTGLQPWVQEAIGRSGPAPKTAQPKTGLQPWVQEAIGRGAANHTSPVQRTTAVQRHAAVPQPRVPGSARHVVQPAQMSWAELAAKNKPPQKPPEKPKVVAKAQAPTYSIVITNAAKKHYKDGWGAEYEIESDQQLEEMVERGFEADEGQHNIFLGDYIVKGKDKGCNLIYTNEWTGSHCKTIVTHCGPSSGA